MIFQRDEDLELLNQSATFSPGCYNLLRANGCDNIKNATWRAAIDIDALLGMPRII